MYVSQEAETLAVHFLLTIQDTEAIKRNSRNVRKRRVFTQRVTFMFIEDSYIAPNHTNNQSGCCNKYMHLFVNNLKCQFK